ncbi:hypothetical protein EW026_g564 [Hermanssonia centrifuga]|uniref:Uncharacterized protein n=1 Tax=Hermanssonia centrifuga TaxID=98765 RepID=A0A4S4KUT8_9APHY|nr:hypothetical protein EW026_g564 [Hermanssonia centrifuga]
MLAPYRKHAKRARQSSAASHHTAANPPRTSRSHSPTYLLKQPAKRRNTMNSRDAAYDESLQAIIEASAAEAAANAVPQDGSSPAVVKPDLVVNGHTENDPEAEVVVPGRKKRKRTEDDTNSSKRTRSASIVSDLPHGNNAAPEASPIATTKPSLPLPTTTATTATKPAQPRARRGGGRKAQVQELAEGEEVASTSSGRRQTSGRSKANAAHEHGARRSYANGVNGHGPSSHAATAAASRAYHNSHAYAVSQQPLFTSWNLPDYLAHLEQLLPTETPRPLELRGFGTATNGQDSADRTTERGVKVKWPSKRMSVVDMNKRVRALVEWVGREQANATERTRRREAVEKSLGERDTATADRSGALDSVEGRTNSLLLEGGTLTQSPAEEHQLPSLSARFITSLSLEGPGPDPGKETMKLMEELMEELISFQERFGPGAKIKERERRTATS